MHECNTFYAFCIAAFAIVSPAKGYRELDGSRNNK